MSEYPTETEGGSGVPHANPSGTPQRAAESPKDFSKRSVLIADDEASIRDLLSRIVSRRLGCSTRFAETGKEVLEILRKGPCDVLITDMVMPGLHGLELLQAVRKESPGLDIIVMTGFTDEFPYVDVLRAGAGDFISKPFPVQEVEAKLLRLFQERDLRERLRSAEQKYRSLFEQSMEGNLLLNPVTFEIGDANRAFCELSGRERADLAGTSLLDLLSPADRERIETSFGIFASGGQGTLGDVILYHSSGQELSVDVSVTFISEPDEDLAFVTLRDVTEKRAVEDQLALVAQTDKITGLSNRRTLDLHLDSILRAARRDGTAVSLMFIDIDDFKKCNDAFGHQKGDELLASLGTLIRQCIRDGRGDEGFRYGGDEFAVLLTGATKEGAHVVGERLRSEFEKGQSFGTTLSIGIAEFGDGMKADTFIHAADRALYKAKEAGKNLVHVA